LAVNRGLQLETNHKFLSDIGSVVHSATEIRSYTLRLVVAVHERAAPVVSTSSSNIESRLTRLRLKQKNIDIKLTTRHLL
jgi:hypothetical protein